MAEIRWSLTSEEDLQSIEAVIARDSEIRAINFVNHLIECAEALLILLAGPARAILAVARFLGHPEASACPLET